MIPLAPSIIPFSLSSLPHPPLPSCPIAQLPSNCRCRSPCVHASLHERERRRRGGGCAGALPPAIDCTRVLDDASDICLTLYNCVAASGCCCSGVPTTGSMPLLVTRCLELQVLGYCSDITRTTAVGAAMSDDQRVVWNAVQHTLQASLLLHTAGAWPALHFSFSQSLTLHQAQAIMTYTATRRSYSCATSHLLV